MSGTTSARRRLKGAGRFCAVVGVVVAMLLMLSVGLGAGLGSPLWIVTALASTAIVVRACRLAVIVEGRTVHARSWFGNRTIRDVRDVRTTGFNGVTTGPVAWLEVLRVQRRDGSWTILQSTGTTPGDAQRLARRAREELGIPERPIRGKHRIDRTSP